MNVLRNKGRTKRGKAGILSKGCNSCKNRRNGNKNTKIV